MYSPALLPSRWRAAVAKKRIWSTIGGISSLRHEVRRLAAVLDLQRDQLVGPRLDRVGDAEQRQRPLARRGVAPALERGGCGRIAASTSASPRQRRRRVLLAGRRVDDAGGATVGRVDVLHR